MERTRATAALNVAVGYQWASLLFLPGIYTALGNQPAFEIEQMGLFLTVRLLGMYISLGVFAWASIHWPRNKILCWSIVTGGAFTLFNMFCDSFALFLVMNLMAGICLGAVVPITRSLIPNYYEIKERGRYFGYLEMSSGVGGILGTGLAQFITSTGAPDAWRMVFFTMAISAFPVAITSLFWVVDPLFDPREYKELIQIFPGLQHVKDDVPTKRDLREMFTNPVYLGILGQGLGAFPWSGNSFLILWFQRMGIPQGLAFLIFLAVGVGAALGGLIGGILGDACARRGGRWAKYGRIWVAHFSMIMGIPYIAVLVNAVPYDWHLWWVYLLLGGAMGLTIAWPPANNSTILSDVFPQRMHAHAFAIQYWFEGGIASFSPYVIGELAKEVFGGGDITPPGGEREWDAYSWERKEKALRAMAASFTFVAALFWGVAQFFYIPIYLYYPSRSLSLEGRTPPAHR